MASQEDLMICSIVCKMWRRLAQELIGWKFSVTVYENELTSLLNDIPSFSDRVSDIQVKISNVEMDRRRASLNLLDILLICPNLVSVEFQFDSISEYLQTLINSTRRLDHIQSFRTPKLAKYNTDHAIDLLIQLQLEYRATITCFEIRLDERYESHRGYDHLIELVSNFPKMIAFEYSKLGFRNSDLPIDQLLEATYQPIQRVVLNIFRINIRSLEPLENTDVTNLDLTVFSMNIRTLEYILTKFKKLEHLWLSAAVDVETDDESHSVAEIKHTLQLSRRIEHVNFSIYFKDYHIVKEYNEQEIRFELILDSEEDDY
ncbi:hypothetical protein BD770DRAFT_411050 [Pilaira anomala]|nr:hypothetical protein BD770DRAFT_411050 [Pilaira anomala]